MTLEEFLTAEVLLSEYNRLLAERNIIKSSKELDFKVVVSGITFYPQEEEVEELKALVLRGYDKDIKGYRKDCEEAGIVFPEDK